MLFDKLKNSLGDQPSQLLLTPKTVTLSQVEKAACLEHTDLLERAGFAVEDFGRGALLVREAPMYLPEEDIPFVLSDLAGRIQSHRGAENELLDELLAFVSEHLQEKITVSDTARKLHVSESTVTHLCSKRLGLSFYRYVTQQRLDRARQLMLENGDLSTVAEKAGFCDYTAFFRALKQEYGLSPSEYRKIHG
jgi:AraC-like DNA-binding protein